MENQAFRELTQKMMQYYTAGEYPAALSLVEAEAGHFPEQAARTTFWKLCLFSLANRPEEVLSAFKQALDDGLWWAEEMFMDPDLDAVRDLPEFKRLVEASDKKCAEAQSQVKPAHAVLVPDGRAAELPLLIALHGRNGNANSHLEYWEVARRKGWLVLAPQSTQALFPDSYCWDKTEQSLKDILFHFEEIAKAYKIDRQRIIVSGFSQGGGLSIYTALSGKVGARGFIGVSTWWADPAELGALAKQAKGLRGYFITGEKDQTLDTVKAIQKVLTENNIAFAEEVHADLGHEFPSDFEKPFDKAMDFIFKEAG